MYTPLLLITLLATTSFSKPTPHPFSSHSTRALSARGFENPYVVTNYTTSCGNAGCMYSFNINFTTTGYTTETNFATSCNGTDIENNYVACAPVADGSQVLANETAIFEASNLTVQHIYETQNPWEKNGEPLSWTNQGTVVVGISPNSSFTITHAPVGNQDKEDS